MDRGKGTYLCFCKRLIDFLLSLCALLIFWPVLLAIAILVRVKLGAPVIFKQERPGKNEKIFKLYKFRSMADVCDEDGNLLPDDARLTKFGKLLRSTSLDELPELLNILKGDMSIVGPRPLLVEYLEYYTAEERIRHSVCPGLTGLAQVNGRNAISWEDRFKLDTYYVNNCSLLLDIKIIFKTIIKIFKRSDILVGSEIPAGRLDAARNKVKL